MSLVKRSLAGVDEFEDSDTKNRFYRWRDIKAEAERLDNEEDQEITRGAASLHRRLPSAIVNSESSMASTSTPSTGRARVSDNATMRTRRGGTPSTRHAIEHPMNLMFHAGTRRRTPLGCKNSPEVLLRAPTALCVRGAST